jgi:hypothetical protein
LLQRLPNVCDSNLLAVGMAGLTAAGVTVGRFARRLAKPS